MGRGRKGALHTNTNEAGMEQPVGYRSGDRRAVMDESRLPRAAVTAWVSLPHQR